MTFTFAISLSSYALLLGGSVNTPAVSAVQTDAPQTIRVLVMDGVRVQFTARDEWLVQYEPGVAAGDRAAILGRFPALQQSSVIEDVAVERAEVISAPAGLNAAARAQLIDALIADPEIAFATTVFNANGDRMAPLARLFIQLRNPENADELDRILADKQLMIVEHTSWRAGNYTVAPIDATSITAGDVVRIAADIQDRFAVEFCQPDFLRWTTPLAEIPGEPNDPLFKDQWALRNLGTIVGGAKYDGDLDAMEAWCIRSGCSLNTIAVLDDGFDLVHPDLKSKFVAGYDFVDGDSDPSPGGSHGTACAGIAAASSNNKIGITGVDWNAALLPVRVLGTDDAGKYVLSTDRRLFSAIVWAVQHDADVLSSSWGWMVPLPQTRLAIQYALDSGRDKLGCVVVFAAGNENGAMRWPGAYPEVLTVGALNPCDKRKTPLTCDGEDWGGSFGPELDVSAPGVLIATTDIHGADGYKPGDYTLSFNGTSSATPYVAGVASLVLCRFGSYTQEQVQTRIKQTCDKLADYAFDATTGHNDEVGHGRVNAYRALSGKPQETGTDGEVSSFEDWSDAPYPRARCKSACCEFLGLEFSPEQIDGLSPDPDGKPNEPNHDGFDDGVKFFPPYVPGTMGKVEVTVHVEDLTSPRYKFADGSDIPLYINVWFDWEADGDFGEDEALDWVVKNKDVYPATFEENLKTFTLEFMVPGKKIHWHMPSPEDDKFLYTRTRLSYNQKLLKDTDDVDAGETEDDRFLNFIEMFEQFPPGLAYMRVHSLGCDDWLKIGDYTSGTCHPDFFWPGDSFNAYAAAEDVLTPPPPPYWSGLRTPSLDLTELSEAFLHFEYSGRERAMGEVKLYKNGAIEKTLATIDEDTASCVLKDFFYDLTPWCGGPSTDRYYIEFETLAKCEGAQDWKIDNIFVWGDDVKSPSPMSSAVFTRTSRYNAKLDWTAPGDDTDTNTAELYNFRVGFGPLTEIDDWRHALWIRSDQAVYELPIPADPGSAESAEFTSLDSGLNYCYLLTQDEVTNYESSLTLAGSNSAPTITAPVYRVAVKGDAFTFDVFATDPDFDLCTLSGTPLPGRVDEDGDDAAFTDNGDNTGAFTWTPDAEDVGLHTVFFTARDPAGLSHTVATDIDVVDELVDCNHNGIDDREDIATGSSADVNHNGIPDECEEDCDRNGVPDASEGLVYGPVIFVNHTATGADNGASWSDAFVDLQDALYAAVCAGSTEIWVAAGKYKPDAGTAERGRAFNLPDGVRILGGFDGTETLESERDWVGNTTILSGDLSGDDDVEFGNRGENSYHVVTAGAVSSTAVLDGFTVSGGNANGVGDPEFTDAGGGIRIAGGSPSISNCRVMDNSAKFGGGGEVFFGSPVFTDCRFAANHSDSEGGGLHNNRGDVTLTRCTFDANAAGGYGGALRLVRAEASVSDCDFLGNTASNGGAMLIDNTSAAAFDRVVIRGNASTTNGGAIYVDRASTATFINALVEGNDAGGSGGAAYNSGRGSRLEFFDSTISQNRAATTGGVFNAAGASTIANVILYYNEDDGGSDEAAQVDLVLGSLDIDYTCIQGWTGSLGGSGNFDAVPVFVALGSWSGSDFTAGDAHLSGGSPCIDAGDNASIPAGVTLDLDSAARIVDGNGDSIALVDLGAYERQLPLLRGDMNCDGAVDFDDIDAFVIALISRDDYESGYPDCNWFNGDINEDGFVNFDDIDGFVECLIIGGCP